MKLEVGMYVRTKNNPYIPSEIAQIIKMDNKYIYLDIDKDSNVVWEYPEYIEKASFNVIDVLEKGDYVNGHRVEEIDFENEEIFTDSEYYCGIVEFSNVKSVITHEQMEQMEYKVED